MGTATSSTSTRERVLQALINWPEGTRLTQEALAQAAGVGRATLSRPDYWPATDTQSTLARALEEAADLTYQPYLDGTREVLDTLRPAPVAAAEAIISSVLVWIGAHRALARLHGQPPHAAKAALRQYARNAIITTETLPTTMTDALNDPVMSLPLALGTVRAQLLFLDAAMNDAFQQRQAIIGSLASFAAHVDLDLFPPEDLDDVRATLRQVQALLEPTAPAEHNG